MAVRAKFRCHSIKLIQATRTREGIEYDYDQRKYVDKDTKEPVEDQRNVTESWHQPTVYLSAVYDGQGENHDFFTATPSAQCELTINNPHGAEFFELGGEYYVDFSRAN